MPKTDDTQQMMLAQLNAGLEQIELSCTQQQCQQLIDYTLLLLKRNKAYNLIANSTVTDIISRHILDSLVVVQEISAQRLLDVGCGAGLPGIPLAVLCPEKEIMLLDSNGKKTRFVEQAIRSLSLSNASVIQSRVEAYKPKQDFDAVISRAYASLGKGLKSSAHVVGDNGVFYFLKGRISDEELREVAKPYILHRSQQLVVPGTDADRHLIEIRKRQDNVGS